MADYWQVRMRNEDGEFARLAWDRGEIGIWYGAWTAKDFGEIDRNLSGKAIAEKLNRLSAQKLLKDKSPHWKENSIPDSTVGTAKRFFYKISAGDWAVVYLKDKQEIGLAQMVGAVRSNRRHELNTSAGEIFKYRKIINKKTFALDDLPDVYRLVSSQGRGNIHLFPGMNDQIKLLAEHSLAEFKDARKRMEFDRLLDLMGPSEWESFCVSWLIMEQNFIPTGLSTGRTLKDVDIVGRNRVTSKRIIAQCKKNPSPIAVDIEFISKLANDDDGYYFTFGGFEEVVPNGVRVFDRIEAMKWIKESENGKLFKQLYLS